MDGFMAQRRLHLVLALLAVAAISIPSWGADAIVPLTVQGENFVDPAGKPVRFWGVNLVALYPSHAVADKVAENLAARQINLVRPHHMLRSSSDWVIAGAPIVALQDYSKGTTREPDPAAWDRFDYLSAALRKRGIYQMLSIWWTRRYQPGDVDVLKTDDADRKAWMDAVEELNGWQWRKAFDPRKMLSMIDDRAAALNEEFARQLLTHVNPYTKLTYGQDPQTLTVELMNECSSEYIIVCGNRFPDYFQKKLTAKWEAFARDAGIEPGDLYKPANPKAVTVRAQFLNKLDKDFLLRMKKVVEETGCKAPVEFSNLWEGDNAQRMYAQNNGFIEDHMYADPMVASGLSDFVLKLSHTPIAGKPFIVGELNQSESPKTMAAQGPVRTMLPAAASVYGSLQNWSGITFFAWMHGDKLLGEDGWATTEGRKASIGNMISDGMMLDHLRTCGMIFRRGLLERSTAPITLHVDEPLYARNYNELMRGKYAVKPGWQNIHELRKTYGPAPADQAQAAWLTESPGNPLVSDTKQIVKDIDRKQLTAAAPQAEVFSGWLDGKAPAGLKHLNVGGEGFATVVVVSNDGKDLDQSTKLVLSRTNVAKGGDELDGPTIRLAGLKQPEGGATWHLRITRPRDQAQGTAKQLTAEADGALRLPGGWHECELELSE
jgi:hypothetical protein